MIHDTKQLAAIVKDYRKKLNLSQNNIANLVGLQQKTISAFETKPNATQLDTLFRILAATNLELHLVPKNTTNNQNGWSEEW